MFKSLGKILIYILFLLSFFGIGFSFSEISGPAKIPLGGQYGSFQSSDVVSGKNDKESMVKNLTGAISFDQALGLGLAQNPKLAAAACELRASQARRIQEGLFPNPEIEASVENFGGDKDIKGFDGAETTFLITQSIELAGKRAQKKQVLELENELSRWDYESKRLDVLTDISKSFWDVVAAQKQVEIAGELSVMAEEMHRLAAERVKAGKASPIEEIQSSAMAATAHIEFENAKRTLETARKKLASTWGSAQPVFDKAVADLDRRESPPPFENLKSCLSQNPDLARWDTEIKKARVCINLADAGRIPDLTLGAGPRYDNETDDTAFVFNISVPIPIFNRNQGAGQEARFELASAQENRKSAQLKTEIDLAQAHQKLVSSYITAESLLKTAIPAAESVFSATMEGYRAGKINYLAVLEARRTYVELKRQYIATALDYHQSKTDIERLISCSISQLSSCSKENI